MEPTQLQLVLNVVTITGMTSLAGYCYLLKKENRKLASERKADSARRPKPQVVKAARAASDRGYRAGHPPLRRKPSHGMGERPLGFDSPNAQVS